MVSTDLGFDAPSDEYPLRRSVFVALALSVAFLVGTGYVSLVTLIDRIQSTDVMTAVSGDVWSPTLVGHLAFFALNLLLLHVGMGAVALLLACATAAVWPELRRKRDRILVGWFCLLAAAVIAFNALWYPRTFFGKHYYQSMVQAVGPLHAGQWIYGTVSILALALLARASFVFFRRQNAEARRTLARAGAVGLAVTVGVVGFNFTTSSAQTQRDADRPNIIIIGVDSLRLDELRRFGGTAGNTRNLDLFLEDADIVRDASTPMPRTFGSWVSILTGRSPVSTGARNNLTPRDVLAANPTIADVLRTAGYRTVYSTDEVRFANIDESFGFDAVITPPISAADFIIGTYNELPLPSVVINTRIGQGLFPFSYGNRGAAQVFQPDTYLERLNRELQFDRPTFLIVHLTASHWPYYTAETPLGIAQKSPTDRPMYRNGLQTADRMFGQLVGMLRSKGAFDNAIVVVLSDHGEALMLPNDAIVKEGAILEDLRAPIKVLNIGHGQSVLSPTQYKVLIGFKAFGARPAFSHGSRDIGLPSTVEDIAPTLLDLTEISAASLKSSGISLAPLLRTSTSQAGADDDRVRFTETDLTVIPDVAGNVDEVGTAKENAKFFEIEPSTGRIRIRHKMLPLVRAYKERAAFTTRHILAALPAGPYAHQYLYFDIGSGAGRLLMARPGPDIEQGALLWDALHTHYAGELMPPVRTEMSDWPAIDREWREYLVKKPAQVEEHATSSASVPNPAQ